MTRQSVESFPYSTVNKIGFIAGYLNITLAGLRPDPVWMAQIMRNNTESGTMSDFDGMLVQSNLVAGLWSGADSGATIPVLNPATGAVLGKRSPSWKESISGDA